MFEKGVSSEEILLQKYVNVEERSNFRQSKDKSKGTHLPLDEQVKIRHQVYTSNEMRSLWEQLFLYHSGVGHHEAFLHMKKKERHRRQSTSLKRLVMDRKSMKFNVTNYEGGNREEKKQAINNSSESSSRFSGSDTDSEYERAFEDRIQIDNH